MKTLSFITTGISLIILIMSPIVLTEEEIQNESVEGINISIEPDSEWSVTKRKGLKSGLKLNYLEGDVSVWIDMDKANNDSGSIGISFQINGNKFSSANSHFISPIIVKDQDVEWDIHVKGGEIMIFTRGGTLGDLAQIDFDKPLKMHASIEIVDQRLNVDLAGLYSIASNLGSDYLVINQLTGINKYQVKDKSSLEDVEFILVETESGTPIYISTQSKRIQISELADSEMMLDFGCSYSQGGQRSVATNIVIDTIIEFNPQVL